MLLSRSAAAVAAFLCVVGCASVADAQTTLSADQKLALLSRVLQARDHFFGARLPVLRCSALKATGLARIDTIADARVTTQLLAGSRTASCESADSLVAKGPAFVGVDSIAQLGRRALVRLAVSRGVVTHVEDWWFASNALSAPWTLESIVPFGAMHFTPIPR